MARLPTSGQISMNDINTNLGNLPGSECSLSGFSVVTGLSQPLTISDYYGYDDAWMDVGNGWLQVTILERLGTSPYQYTRATIINRSQNRSFTDLLYWRFLYFGSPVQVGSMTSGTFSANTSYFKSSSTYSGGWPANSAQISWNSLSGPWISVPFSI